MLRDLLILTLLATVARPLLAADSHIATYTGRLNPVRLAEDDHEASEKGFAVNWFRAAPADPRAEAMCVVKEDLHALPWFLRVGFVSPAGPDGPVIGYRLDGKSHLVELPPLVMAGLDDAGAGNQRRKESTETIDGRDCRVFEGQLPSGGAGRMAIDAETSQLVRYTSNIVLGRGDRFELSLTLSKTQPLADETASQLASLSEDLKDVLPDVSEVADPVSTTIPPQTLETIASHNDQWRAAANGTPYQSFVDAMLRDVKERRESHRQIRKVSERLTGSPAPQLPQTRLDGTPLDPETLQDKTLVLHFWGYDIEPLAAPFGQVGSLDFVAREHAMEGDDVVVVGIAVDEKFAEPATSDAAMRSSRRFAEFMNLGYTICRDDGTLLRKWGDPLSLGAKLPLWVVIGPDKDVRYYKTGLIAEKPGDGLKELDAAIAGRP